VALRVKGKGSVYQDLPVPGALSALQSEAESVRFHGTPGNVSNPVVVGFGGWLDFKFLFSGRNLSGEDRIYAVDQNGQLLSYGDAGTPKFALRKLSCVSIPPCNSSAPVCTIFDAVARKN
jgi:hypothetical protein